jgi:hypothetical protein
MGPLRRVQERRAGGRVGKNDMGEIGPRKRAADPCAEGRGGAVCLMFARTLIAVACQISYA